jgi:hypothetical protein
MFYKQINQIKYLFNKKKTTYSDVSIPSVGADSSGAVVNPSVSSTTVVLFITSSVVVVVMIISDPDGIISLDGPFSVVSTVVDGTITVDSVTFVT